MLPAEAYSPTHPTDAIRRSDRQPHTAGTRCNADVNAAHPLPLEAQSAYDV